MPGLLVAILIGLAFLVVALPVLRWAVRAERRATDRQALGRIYYPTRGRKADVPSLRSRRAAYPRHDEWLIDLDGDE